MIIFNLNLIPVGKHHWLTLQLYLPFVYNQIWQHFGGDYYDILGLSPPSHCHLPYTHTSTQKTGNPSCGPSLPFSARMRITNIYIPIVVYNKSEYKLLSRG